MKISKIEIGAFGKLKDYTLEFRDGFNIIYGENENGKSTVMAFIKMMFYGSGGRGGQQLAKNPRKKYLPWSGEKMCGRITFLHGGRQYCLEREFKGGDATDRVILRDLDLGTEETVSGEIGTRFFGVGLSAFERSTFIGQAGTFTRDDTANGELNGKLSNLALTGDEDTSFRTVADRLESAAGALVTKRHVGLYDKTVEQLNLCQNRLQEADAAAKRQEALEEKIELLKKQLIDTKARYDAAKKTVDSEQDIRQAEKLREYLSVKDELDALNETLKLKDGKLLDGVFLGKLRFCLSRCENDARRAEERRTETDRLRENIRQIEEEKGHATPEQLAELTETVSALKEKREKQGALLADREEALHTAEENAAAPTRKKAFHPVFLTVGAILILGAVAAFLLSYTTVAIAAAAVGLIGIFLAFVLRPEDRAWQQSLRNAVTEARDAVATAKNDAAGIQEELTQKVSEMTLITAALNSDTALLNQRKSDLAQRETQACEAEEQLQKDRAELCDLFRRYADAENEETVLALLPELDEKVEKQKQIKLRLNLLSDDLGRISYEEAAQKLEAVKNAVGASDTDFAAAKETAERLRERGMALTAEYSAAVTELENDRKHAIDPQTVRRELQTLTEKATAQKQYYDAAVLAHEVLTESYGEVRRGYGVVLEQKTLGIFSQLTCGRYRNVSVSDAMELSAEESETFGRHDAEAFSTGTADQAYLSLRLALSGFLGDGEPLPVFLDDVLAQYDDRRAEAALRFLKTYAEHQQTVLFTCHQSICDAAESLGIGIQKM